MNLLEIFVMALLSIINFNIEYLNHRNKIGLTGYYRPPSFNTLEYLGDLEQYLQQVDLVDLEIFTGDMNIDLLNDESSETNSYLDILSSYGFASYINKAIRETTTSKSDIDHIFVRKKSIIEDKVDIDPIVFHTDLSDHYSPFIFIAFGENLKRGQIENGPGENIMDEYERFLATPFTFTSPVSPLVCRDLLAGSAPSLAYDTIYQVHAGMSREPILHKSK
nr:unnamed protein product [Callosobruchus analis]